MAVPEFLARLRQSVGHDLLWLPAASAVVVDDEGRLLLGRRADNGQWAVIGGILDPGEQPAVGITREVLEETGVEVEVIALTSVVAGEVVRYDNGDLAQYLDVCFLCRPIGGEAHVADDESLEVGWFHTGELPVDLMPTSAERISRALRHLGASDGRNSTGSDVSAAPLPWFVRP